MTIRDADTSDFRCFYEAARVVRLGLDPYDRVVWSEATMSDPARLPPCDPTFVYPLWTAAAMIPFSLPPEPPALALWEAMSLVLLIAAAALIARAWSTPRIGPPLLVMVLWSQPAFSAIANAQFGPVLFAATSALAFALPARPKVAVLAWVTLLLKPHVVAATLLGTLIHRRLLPRALVVLAVITAASLLLDPRWPAEVLGETVTQSRLADPGLATFWGLADAWGLSAGFALAAAAASVALIVVLAPRRRLLAPELIALLAPASLLIAPYARPHDQIVLAVSWAATLACAERAPRERRRAMVLGVAIVAVVLPWAVALGPILGLPSGLGVFVSLATGALAAVSLPRGGVPASAKGAPLG